MKKLKTHIPGLDELFQGGIQIDCKTRHKSEDDSSLVIVIRGERGTNKHLFAMQLMHGLARSMRERNKEMDAKNNPMPQQYFSINKPTQSLEDMYLDLLISRWIYLMTKALKRQYTYQIDSNSAADDGSRYCCTQKQINYREAALRFWFDVDNQNSEYLPPYYTRVDKNKNYAKKYSQMLADNVINYNPRTNAIHYRRLFQGDSNDNLLFYRKHDAIGKYIEEYKEGKQKDVHEYTERDENIDYSFDTEFINVDFNKHLIGNTTDIIISRNSRQALASFQKILRYVESEIEIADREHTDSSSPKDKDTSYKENAKGNQGFLHDVVVIDGFSHIDTESLKTLPYTHMQNKLRRYARVSILVFDDRKESDCDGDIVIDLRISTDKTQEYTFHEMQISKSTFQTRALGWHRFKRRDYGIVVFPSIHLRLTRRYYVAHLLNEIGNGMLENTYSTYLASKLHSDSADRKLLHTTEDKLNEYFNNFYYEDYLKSQNDIDKELLWELFSSRYRLKEDNEESANNSILLSKEGVDDKFVTGVLLSQMLLGDRSNIHDTKNSEIKSSGNRHLIGFATHYPVSTLVGNPNSFKRMLVLSSAFHWAKKKEHVLFVLFDKNEEDLRRQMLCPGLYSKVRKCENKETFFAETSSCRECDRFIHFLGLRPGCISAEEFLSVLLEQISIYCDCDAQYGIERRKLHIIIDDYQRIDFSFPFIKNSTLFTCALINICQEHNVELTILCDKSSERAHEVCTLSDNVMCIRRNPDEVNSFSIYAERMVSPPFPSAIIKYDIKDAQNMFVCDNEGLHLKSAAKIRHTFLGSMKGYWRKTENIIDKTDSQ